MLIGSAVKISMALAAALLLTIQAGNNKLADDTKPEIVPITEEHHHHLVLENEYVRVFHVEVAPHAETLYHQHDMDYVFVTLGDSNVASERLDEKPMTLELKDGDTRFTKGGFAHKAVNLSDKPFVNVTVELKRAVQNDPNGDLTVINGHSGHTIVLSSPVTTCSEWFLVTGGTAMLIPDAKDRLVVAITDLRKLNDQENLKAGDVRWVKGELHVVAEPAQVGRRRPARIVVCDFAHNDFEDIGKTTHRTR